jgi:ABC-type uncharacterized transport system substrate-binding protein
MQKALKVMPFIFVAILIVFLVVTNLQKPRILILHSYYTDFSWVRDINVGLMRVLKDKPYSIRYYYMDTKRHPSEKYKQKVGAAARLMINSWKPNIIIAVDDNAQKYVSLYYRNDPNIKIIFTGVNATAKTYGFDKSANVTGVLERIPFQEFREVFTQILPPEKRRIVHISDASTTSYHIHKELDTVDWGSLKLVKSFQCKTIDEWISAIKKAHEIGDILLVTHYHTIKDRKGITMKPGDVMKITTPLIKMPDIGCWGFFVEDGGMMAVAVSPYEQGELAADMVVDIIEKGKSPSDINVKVNSQYVVYIREKSVKRKHLKMPKMLEAFARATNNYFD